MILYRSVLVLGFVLLSIIVASAQSSKAVREISQMRADWSAHLREKKLEAFVTMYAADGVFMGGGKRFTGHQAIRDLTKYVMSSFTSEVETRSIKTEFCGTYAFDSGDYRETLTTLADGTKKSMRGDYLTIYKRQRNGKWRIVQQVWTEDPTPSPNPANAEVLSEVVTPVKSASRFTRHLNARESGR